MWSALWARGWNARLPFKTAFLYAALLVCVCSGEAYLEAGVAAVSPSVVHVGSDATLVLVGNSLGDLINDTDDAVCLYAPGSPRPNWVVPAEALDAQQVGCSIPPIDVDGEELGGIEVNITLRVDGNVLHSLANVTFLPPVVLPLPHFPLPPLTRNSSYIFPYNLGTDLQQDAQNESTDLEHLPARYPNLTAANGLKALVDAPKAVTYTRWPAFQRLVPAVVHLAEEVIVHGRNFPFDLMDADGVRCGWWLTAAVTPGRLLSSERLVCMAPSSSPSLSHATAAGFAERLLQVSFDRGWHYHTVASAGIPLQMLSGNFLPYLVRAAPDTVPLHHAKPLILQGMHFAIFRNLSPSFGTCGFEDGSTHIQAYSTAIFISNFEMACTFPSTLLPGAYTIRVDLARGLEGPNFRVENKLPVEVVIQPSFSLFAAEPHWAPWQTPTQILLHGRSLFPIAPEEGQYWCTFGDAEAVPAERISVRQLACNSEKQLPGNVTIKAELVTQVPKSHFSLVPFRFAILPEVTDFEGIWEGADYEATWPRMVLHANQAGQRLRILGRGLSDFCSRIRGPEDAYHPCIECRFGDHSTSPRSYAYELKLDEDGVWCEAPRLPAGDTTLWLITGARYELKVLDRLESVLPPVATGIQDKVFVDGTLLRAVVQGFHLERYRTERLACRWWAQTQDGPISRLISLMDGWIQTGRSVLAVQMASCGLNASNSTALPEGLPAEVHSACAPRLPLASAADSLRCPKSIHDFLAPLLMDLAQEGLPLEACERAAGELQALLLQMEVEAEDYTSRARSSSSIVAVDVLVELDNDTEQVYCHVPRTDEMRIAVREADLLYPELVQARSSLFLQHALSMAWVLCAGLGSSCDRLGMLNLFQDAELELAYFHALMGAAMADGQSRFGEDLADMTKVFLELVDAGSPMQLPPAAYKQTTAVVFLPPSISSTHPTSASVELPTVVEMLGHNLHPLLDVQCFTEDLNKSWGLWPGVQTSNASMRCELTPLTLQPHMEYIRLILASAVNVSFVDRRGCEPKSRCLQEQPHDMRINFTKGNLTEVLLEEVELMAEDEEEGIALDTVYLSGNDSDIDPKLYHADAPEADEEEADATIPPQVRGLMPNWGWNTGGTLVRVLGQGLPLSLADADGELSVRCDFGQAGIVDALASGPDFVECISPPVTEALVVTVSIIAGSPPSLYITNASTLFSFLHRLHLAQITPVLGYTSGGTNVTLTLTAQPLPSWNFDLDCAFGPNRVPARLMSITKLAAGFRSYTMQCTAPPALDLPRMTEEGCSCKQRWYLPNGLWCNQQCCPVEPGGRPACYVEDKWCQGADWGYCNPSEDTMDSGFYTSCVRVLPSIATEVTEYTPCQHRFVYVTVPLVDAVTPESGPVSGGTNVTVHGRYFPQTGMGLFCRFDTYVSPARWLSPETLTCVAPAALGKGSVVTTVPVTISADGGSQWAVSTAFFTFVPLVQGLISPHFGPQHGGTVLEVLVPTVLQDSFLSWNTSCCFGEPATILVPATRLSDFHFQCATPPWPHADAIVTMGLTQADGRCHPLPRAEFSYVDMWKVTSLYPAAVTNAELGSVDILVSGEHLRPDRHASCKFGNSTVVAAYVLESGTGLLCTIPALNLDGISPMDGITVEVQVTLNGVDYAAGQPPLLLRVNPVPYISRVQPSVVKAVGKEPLRILGSNLGVGLRLCIFGEGHREQVVPITSYTSGSEVVCETPSWDIQPPDAPSELVSLRLAPDGSQDAAIATFNVTFAAVPEGLSIQPVEGPPEGGTLITVHGRYFTTVGRNYSLRCIFGLQESAALVLSSHHLTCVSPPLPLQGDAMHVVRFSIQTTPAFAEPPAQTACNSIPGPNRDLTFLYRRVPISISNVFPLSGPIFGGTLVTIISDYPLPDTVLVKCIFGTHYVSLTLVSRYEANCMSPPNDRPEHVDLMLSTDGQNRVHLGPDGTAVRFQYYIQPEVVRVTPSFGSSTGGTIVQLEGSHFIDDARLACKFDDIVVPAIRFISDRQILCETPAHRPEEVPVSVANNGQNFTQTTHATFTYEDINQPVNITPHLGPVSGGTLVTVTVHNIPSSAGNTLRCFFGTLRAVGTYVNRTHFTCVSPSVVNPGEVTFTITMNLQARSEATQGFLYYDPPYFTQVDPPLGPSSGALGLRLVGSGFISTRFLAVRFGGDTYPRGDEEVRDAIWISDTEIVVDLPVLTHRNHMERVPLYITNNGQNWSPEGIENWEPDEDSHDIPRSMAYFTFHDEVKPDSVEPEYGMIYGGGFVHIYGWGFMNTSSLSCSFGWVESPSVIFMSASHILCEVPNMMSAHSSKALGETELRVSLNGRDWSDSYVDFRFVGVCPIGHYCRHDSTEHYTFRSLPCPTGHYCESVGMSFPSPCAPGTFQAYRRQVQCQLCPVGFYCPRSRMIEPTPCPRGWICDQIGLVTPVKRCLAGHYCGEGVATEHSRLTLRLENQKPRVCPPGLYCLDGAVAPNSKPHNYSTPQPCLQGFFCPPASTSTYGAGGCPLGKYCPTPRHTGLLCPSRYMCGPKLANVEPTPCPEGTFNPWLGQWNCTVCLQGSLCPQTRLRLPITCPCGYECSERGLTRAWKLCPAGLMCDEGVATTIEPKVCRPITFSNTIDLSIPRNREVLCYTEVGEAFVFVSRILTVPDVAADMGYDSNTPLQSGFAACCWTSEKLQSFMTTLSADYYGANDPLSGRTYARLAELILQWTATARAIESSSAGFDGLSFLNVTEESWRDEWLVRWTPARADLLRLKEKMYIWTRPEPCEAGSYCTAGTCPRYLQTAVSQVDYSAESTAPDVGARMRRLQEDVWVPAQPNTTTTPPPWQIHVKSWSKVDPHAFDQPDAPDPALAEVLKLLEQLRMTFESRGKTLNCSIEDASGCGSVNITVQDLSQWMPLGVNVTWQVAKIHRLMAKRAQTTAVQKERRRLTAVSEGFPLNNPLAMRSPRQCVAGTYCNSRADSSDGTGLCPAGFSCMPGADAPQEAPEGVFVTEAGRVRGVECFPGQFAPFPNTAECFPCPAGYSCPNFGTTVPFICPPGTYRTPQVGNGSSTTIACRPCGQGRWSPWRGATDIASCEPCPRGRMCSLNTGNVTQTTACPGGYMCGETTGNATEAQVCPDGFYCGPSTDPVSYTEFLCPAGFFCGSKTSEANRFKFRCPLGFYCPSGTGFKEDLQRQLVAGTVYIIKEQFYLMQMLAKYCARHKMYELQKQIFEEKAILEERGLPPMEETGERAVISQWLTEFLRDRPCQLEAVDVVLAEYAAAQLVEDMQGRDFLANQLLVPTFAEAADYSNKCYEYSPDVGGLGWPDPCVDENPDDPCDPVSQLQCLCTAPSITAMLECLYQAGTGHGFNPNRTDFPRLDCIGTEKSSVESWCIDWTLQVDANPAARRRRSIARDEFDLMSRHYLAYVTSSMENEMEVMADRGESSQVRCPFATITTDENRAILSECLPRTEAAFLQGEDQQLVVGRVNPLPAEINVNLSSFAGDPSVEEDYRQVFSAPAGSSYLVTFDVRHLPFGYENTMRYGVDWRIKILLNETLRADYDDPVECSNLLQNRELATGSGIRSVVEMTARDNGCVEVVLPQQFQDVWDEEWNAVLAQRAAGVEVPPEDSRGVFTFLIHPLIDCEWRMEVQITNGMYLPDKLLFLRSARIERVLPQRAEVGTNKAFAIEMQFNNNLRVELPYNMPLKSFPGADDDFAQGILQKAFINWLPHTGTLTNTMRHPTEEHDLEYYFQDRELYFQNRNQELIMHLPYFSNCRGFGRTTPFWQIVEQSAGCIWEDQPEEVTLLSLGATARGDKCNPAQVECILDEPPNFPLPGDRWFEAQTGSVIFYVTVDPISGSEREERSEAAQEVVPVYLMNGIRQSGHLPKKVVLVFQYWQKTLTKKEMVKVRAYYADAEAPSVDVLRDRSTEPWMYNLTVLYFPMTHFEVMTSFAFADYFYFLLFTAMGILILGMTLVLWVWHRLLCRLTFRPRLFNAKYLKYILPPVVKGGLFALIPCLPAFGFGMALVRGRVLGLTMPFAQCANPDVISDTCMMGLFDYVQSSYQGETSVDETSMLDRRTGRTGTVLIVMGSYVVLTTLKLIVPRTDSAFYVREDVKKVHIGDDEDKESEGEMSNEVEHFRDDESDSMEPIFTTYLWKRSCLALVVFVNGVFMNVVIQFSYSNLFTKNILICVIAEYSIFKMLQLGLTNFMCEVYLIVPINNIHQITILVTLLAAESVFDFLMCYIALNGLQMIDRVYISANEDWVMAQIGAVVRRFQGYVRWVVKQTTAKESMVFDDLDDDYEEEQQIQQPAAGGAQAEGQTEDMIGFLTDLSTGMVGDTSIPFCYILFWFLYDESKILEGYEITIETTMYYVFFYCVMIIFQYLTNFVTINIAELFHGWHVTDYLEYCSYRFRTRAQGWKGRGESYDETLPPHMRSVDQMCFSEQYYFVLFFHTAGMICWILGLQIILVNHWNLFDDPACAPILLGTVAICKGAHIMTLISASYLKVWVIFDGQARMRKPMGDIMKDRPEEARDGAGGQVPLPPRGSTLDGWPVPSPRDRIGLERYRHAFLKENQLWLQVAFSELEDKDIMMEHREALLKSLTALLGELSIQDYGPGEDTPGLEFGAEPVAHLARAAGEMQRLDYAGSLTQELLRMWRSRAAFMLRVATFSATVKIDADKQERRKACELCARADNLHVVPIYTLTHLASIYREQRDMSPLWNMPLWRHFYQTFTPVCTLCESCQEYYYVRNENVPVDEKRFQRLRERPKTAHELVQESRYQPVPIDADTAKILELWLKWTRHLGNNEKPRDFLPRYGIEGRTMAEIRRERLAEEAEEAEPVKGASSDDEDDEVLEAALQQKTTPGAKAAAGKGGAGLQPTTPSAAADEQQQQQQQISDEEEVDEDVSKQFADKDVVLPWSSRVLAATWLHRARENLRAPQLSAWDDNTEEDHQPPEQGMVFSPQPRR